MVREYRDLMDEIEPTRAMRLVSGFAVNHLSNWYVPRNRRPFWKDEMLADKLAAYQTLYECLEGITKLMAPLAPFLSEYLYRSLNNETGRDSAESVHLAFIPEIEESASDRDLERR